MRHNLTLALILSVEAAVVVAVLLALRSGALPRGVSGEWEWLRVPQPPEANRLFLALVGIAVYCVVAGFLMRRLMNRPNRVSQWVALATLFIAAVMVQGMVQVGAPVGYGLEKWVVAVSQPGSSGYFTVAKNQVRDRSQFLRDYPEWIQKQDALHLGTHPPGLILVESLLLGAMKRYPSLARFVVDHAPESVTAMLKVFGETHAMAPADRATFVLSGLLTLLACSATVLPLYMLSRRYLDPGFAFGAAALWPLVSSAVLFQPSADSAFPFLSTTILAIAVHASGGSIRSACVSGVVCGLLFGVAMELTLAFLAVGLVGSLTSLFERDRLPRRKFVFLFATLLAFLAATLAFWWWTGGNPFATWWWNQRNHARFYDEFPRTYRAWLVANPVELAVGLGLPIVVWALAGLRKPRALPGVSLATLSVLAFLTLGGRNLSEVGRLWLPFMPALVVSAGYGMQVVSAGPKALGATIALLALQVLALESIIQVVYPI